MSLVEGSNGPRLVCEASAEPQAQYRWFLLRNVGSFNGVESSDLAISDILSATPNTRRNFNPKRSSESIIHSAPGKAAQPPNYSALLLANQPINQLANKALDSRGANDSFDASSDSANLIELSGSVSEQVGGPSGVSVLDLSQMSMDRRQSGHYICEASNKLGQRQQSVHVNVLCKYPPNIVVYNNKLFSFTNPRQSERERFLRRHARSRWAYSGAHRKAVHLNKIGAIARAG